jgi:hypothetical protein
MRSVAWVVAAVVGGAAACCSNIATAQPATSSDPFTSDHGPTPETFLLFAGGDLWRNGGFAHGGLLWSPGGIDREGFVGKLLIGSGQYRYRNGAVETTGTVALADVLPGWRFKRGAVEVTVYAGLDLQHHWLSPDDPGNRSRGSHAGLRAGFDLWWEPTTTTMIDAGANFATIGDGYWSRAAFGWKAFDVVYLGPEFLALGDDRYSQWRIGAHATAFKIGNVELSAGAGYVQDSDDRAGFYGRVGVLTRR